MTLEQEKESIWFDHEKRIGRIETQIPAMIQTFELMKAGFDDLKSAVINGNEKSMNFMQSVIKHEQGIEQTRMEFEQKLQTVKLEAQQKQLNEEAEKRKEEAAAKILQEAYERDQKRENRELVKAGIRKFVTWFTPAIVALVAALVAWFGNGGLGN